MSSSEDSSCRQSGCNERALGWLGRFKGLCWAHANDDVCKQILKDLETCVAVPTPQLIAFDFSKEIFQDLTFEKGYLREAQFNGALLINVTFEETDLAGIDFSGAELRRVKFNRVTGTRVDFSRAHLEDCSFSGGSLRQATFYRADLDSVRFERVCLEESRLALAEITDTTFIECTAANSDFQNLRCVGTSFQGGDFKRSFFSDSVFVARDRALFVDVRLDGSQFRRTIFSGEKEGEALEAFLNCPLANCDFDSAQLDFCRFLGQEEIRDVGQRQKTNAISCEFTNAGLEGTVFSNLDLTSGNFSASYLGSTQFENCRLRAARFENTSFIKAKFVGNIDGFCSIFTASYFEDCILSHCEFKSSIFSQTSFVNCILTSISFNDASLVGANFDYCQLQDVKMRDADLQSITIKEEGQRSVSPDCDFSGANLSYADLSNLCLSGCCLELATLDNTWLVNTRLNGVKCRETRFSLCDLSGAEAHPYEGRRADFSGARVIDCKLYNFNSREGIFQNADLSGSSVLSPANPETSFNATFGACEFNFANLRNCHLENVDFQDSKFCSATFDGSVLRGSRLQGVDAESAIFSGALLGSDKPERAANFSNGFIAHGASFEGADLRWCDFTGADLSHSRLDNAILLNTCIKDSKFTGASMVSVQHFDQVRGIKDSRVAPDFSFAHIEGTKFFVTEPSARENYERWRSFRTWLNKGSDVTPEVRRLSWVAWKNNYASLGLYAEQGRCFHEEQVANGWDWPHEWHPGFQVLSVAMVLGTFLLVVGLTYNWLSSLPWWGWSTLAAMVISALVYLLGKSAKLQLLISDFLYGFGEKPVKIFANGFAVVCLFALSYYLADQSPWGEVVSSSKERPDPSSWGEFFYLSIITFATLGYGDLVPIEFCRFLAGLESALGLAMAALFIHALARRTTGR